MTVTSTIQAGKIRGANQFLSDYVVVTSSHTSDNINGFAVSNHDGRVTGVFAQAVVTKGASDATAYMQLEGSNDGGSTWKALQGVAGTDITTASAAISAASTTSVQFVLDTKAYGRSKFAQQLVRGVVKNGAGTNTLTTEGKVHLSVEREQQAVYR